MNAQTSQPSAGDTAHNADLRVVLTSKDTGAEQWRGTFSQLVIDNEGAFTLQETADISGKLCHAGKCIVNMGAGGAFTLAVENPVKCRQCTAINSSERTYCVICRSRLPAPALPSYKSMLDAFVILERTLRCVSEGDYSRNEVIAAGRIASTAIDELKRGGVR